RDCARGFPTTHFQRSLISATAKEGCLPGGVKRFILGEAISVARSITFTVEGTVDTQITVTELDDGTLRFDIQVLGSGSIGDLRGIFFDLEGYTADASLTATGADVTTEVSGEGSVDSVQKDVNLKGEVTNTLGDF